MTAEGVGVPKLWRSAATAHCRPTLPAGSRPTLPVGSAHHCRAPCHRLRALPRRLVVTPLHPLPLHLGVAPLHSPPSTRARGWRGGSRRRGALSSSLSPRSVPAADALPFSRVAAATSPATGPPLPLASSPPVGRPAQMRRRVRDRREEKREGKERVMT